MDCAGPGLERPRRRLATRAIQGGAGRDRPLFAGTQNLQVTCAAICCISVSRTQQFEGRNREGRGQGMFRRLDSVLNGSCEDIHRLSRSGGM
jgi:hypothetical protein